MAAPTASGTRQLLHRTVICPKDVHLASVIFLHGSGDTGDGIRGWIQSLLRRDLDIKNTKVIFPTAPPRPYTPMNGASSTVWFNRKKIAPAAEECIDSINQACDRIGEIIALETNSGIPKNKIVIGGFSMGGNLAYHLAYRFHRDIAGVFALSAFINQKSNIYQALKNNQGISPPLFAAHGGKDPLVPCEWGMESLENLKGLGVQVEFHDFPRLYHELGVQELRLLEEWLVKILRF